jgi:hypothetical protein
MNYQTARTFIIDQGTALITQQNPDAFLVQLQQGKPPIPGQMTSILLALKILFETLQDTPNLDRQLVHAMHLLSYESYRLFEEGRRAGVSWPPLLKEDLQRLELTLRNILSGEWQG